MAVFIVDKPLYLTSHDVVAKARKLLGTKRVGHAGTLDPLASGVLVLLSEGSTKLTPFLNADKHYLAWVSFGASSLTLDAEGPIVKEQNAAHLTKSQIEKALPHFLSLTEQLPPQFSAIKKAGVKAYQAARKGQALELPLRPASYYHIELLAFAKSKDELPQNFRVENGNWHIAIKGITFALPASLGTFPSALFFMQVKAGTYIRSFARDLGERLGVPAHLSGLVRTKAGQCDLEKALKLVDIANSEGLENAKVINYPLISLEDDLVARVRKGQRLSLALTETTGLISKTGKLVAIAEPHGNKMKLLRVWL